MIKTNLIIIPLQLINSFIMPNPSLDNIKRPQTQPQMTATNFTIKTNVAHSENDVIYGGEEWQIRQYAQSTERKEWANITTKVYSQLKQVNNNGSTPYEKAYNQRYLIDITITTYIDYSVYFNAFYKTYDTDGNQNSQYYMEEYFQDIYLNKNNKVNPYNIENGLLLDQEPEIQDEYANLAIKIPQNKEYNIQIVIYNIGTTNTPIINQFELDFDYEKIEITYTSEPIDLPGLLWQIIAMPFAFISQAFDLTLFPGTPYQINLANTFMVFIGLLMLFAILKIVLKIFL